MANFLTGSVKFLGMDSSGNPLANGVVEFYDAGTTTPKYAYPTVTDASNNTNGFYTKTLDARGEATIVLSGNYKITLKDSAGATIWTQDNFNTAGSTTLQDTNGNTVLTASVGSASPVNYLDVANAATGGDVTVTATGSDTNVGLTIACKGTETITLADAVACSSTLTVTGASTLNSTLSVPGTSTLGTATITTGNITTANLVDANTDTLRVDGTNSSTSGRIVFREASSNGSNGVSLLAPTSIASDYSLILPTGVGSANNFMTSDGSGQLTWSTVNSLTQDTTPDAANDFLMTWDASASTHKKITLNSITSASQSLVAISSGTLSSATQLSITGLTTEYYSYLIYLDYWLPATDGVTLRLQVSTDGGSTWVSSGYFHTRATFSSSAIATHGGTGGGSDTQIQLTGGTLIGSASNEGVHFARIEVTGASDPNLRTMATCKAQIEDQSSLVYMVDSIGASTVAAHNAVRILFSSGNIASGYYRVYGIKA